MKMLDKSEKEKQEREKGERHKRVTANSDNER